MCLYWWIGPCFIHRWSVSDYLIKPLLVYLMKQHSECAVWTLPVFFLCNVMNTCTSPNPGRYMTSNFLLVQLPLTSVDLISLIKYLPWTLIPGFVISAQESFEVGFPYMYRLNEIVSRAFGTSTVSSEGDFISEHLLFAKNYCRLLLNCLKVFLSGVVFLNSARPSSNSFQKTHTSLIKLLHQHKPGQGVERVRCSARGWMYKQRVYSGVDIRVHAKLETCIPSLLVRFTKPHVWLLSRIFSSYISVTLQLHALTMPTIHYKWLLTRPQSPDYIPECSPVMRRNVRSKEAVKEREV